MQGGVGEAGNVAHLTVNGGDIIIAGGLSGSGGLSGTGGKITFQSNISSNTLINRAVMNNNGQWVLTPGTSTTGSPNLIRLDGPAHTTLTASVEASDVLLNLNRSVQFTGGALAIQRAVNISTVAYVGTSTMTISTAATVAIQGSPVAGASVTIANSWAFLVQSGSSAFNGNVNIAGVVNNSTPSALSPEFGTWSSSVTVGNSGAPASIFGAPGNTDASPGNYGEYIYVSSVTLTNIPGLTGVYKTIMSTGLPAGDWDVTAQVVLYRNGSTVTGPFGINIATYTLPGTLTTVFGDTSMFGYPPVVAVTDYTDVAVNNVRFNYNTAKTLYVDLVCTFSGATPQFVGRLSARRIR